jgi:nitroreductase
MSHAEGAAFDALLERRHSCRAFLDTPIDRSVIVEIVASAQKVPSWCNAQPWQLIVTSGPETDRLRAHLHARSGQHPPPQPDFAFPETYEGVYDRRRKACGWALYEAVGVARGDRAASARQVRENFRFFGAPHVAIVTTPRAMGTYGAVDCGAFVTAFMLAAAARGVASVAQAAIAAEAPVLHDWFAIPPDRAVLCAISFGLADPDHPANAVRTERAPPEEVIAWR